MPLKKQLEYYPNWGIERREIGWEVMCVCFFYFRQVRLLIYLSFEFSSLYKNRWHNTFLLKSKHSWFWIRGITIWPTSSTLSPLPPRLFYDLIFPWRVVQDINLTKQLTWGDSWNDLFLEWEKQHRGPLQFFILCETRCLPLIKPETHKATSLFQALKRTWGQSGQITFAAEFQLHKWRLLSPSMFALSPGSSPLPDCRSLCPRGSTL